MTDERGHTRPGLVLYEVPHPNDGNEYRSAPYKYTRGLHEAIVRAVSEGHRPGAAAAAAGISEQTFNDWMLKGERGDPYLSEFYDDIQMAMGQAEVRVTQTVLDARIKDPKMALAWLERQRSKHWAPQVKMIVEQEFDELLGRFEKAFPPHVYEKILAVACGADSSQATTSDEAEEDS